jgi:hypothetical protein
MAHESWPVVKNVCIEENRIIWNDGVNKYQLRVDLRQVRDDMDTEERNQVPDEIYKQYELSTLGELLSRPQDFDRKYVYVTGYYCGEFEGTALYRTLDDIRQMRHGKGIWVDAMLPFGEDGSFDYQREFDDQHVLAEGWFDIKRKGHLSGWPATLHVKHMSVLKKEDENHESGQEE